MEGYWKKTTISGRIVGLFKVEETEDGYATYRYKDGSWNRDDNSCYEFSWDDDFDPISEDEAKKIMEAFK